MIMQIDFMKDKLGKMEIENVFNKDVAELVDGVTKISKLNFSTKNDQNMANTRKNIRFENTSATKNIQKTTNNWQFATGLFYIINVSKGGKI